MSNKILLMSGTLPTNLTSKWPFATMNIHMMRKGSSGFQAFMALGALKVCCDRLRFRFSGGFRFSGTFFLLLYCVRWFLGRRVRADCWRVVKREGFISRITARTRGRRCGGGSAGRDWRGSRSLGRRMSVFFGGF